MIENTLDLDEQKRIHKLNSYNILDTNPEESFNKLAELAAYICNTPIAFVSLVDLNRQWFKAKVGLDICETPRDIAFCSQAIKQTDILIIEDTLNDPLFALNPLVINDPKIRFYAGAPLITKDGHALGTICVIDRKPKFLDANQKAALKTLSDQVIAQMELRIAYDKLHKHSDSLELSNNHKDQLFKVISHDLRSPFNSILGFADILKNNLSKLNQEEIKEISTNIGNSATSLYNMVKDLLNWALSQDDDFKINITPIPLEPLFNEIVTILSGKAHEKNISIKCTFDDNCIVSVDRNMIFSVFQNLISNAIKFTPNGGSIIITGRIHFDFVKIIIKDSGIGMDNETISNLMHSGRVESKNGTFGESGSGIGFMFAKDFLERNNGTISITSKPGVGTIIRVELPSVKKN